MATALDTRVWQRNAEPAELETALTALWREVGQETHVVRATMSNLVVVVEREPNEEVDFAAPIDDVRIEDIARRHPARMLLLHHIRHASLECPPLAASVGVIMFGTEGSQYGVELLAVHSRCSESSLPSIVRRLTLGDLPTTVWWTGDLSRNAPILALVRMGRQFVYDSRRWRDVRAGMTAIAQIAALPARPVIVDLNWRRLAPLRAALASVFRGKKRLLRPDVRLHIQHRPADAPLGRLVAGWLAARMDWRGDDERITVEEWRHGDDVLQVIVTDDAGTSIICTQNGHRAIVRDPGCQAPVVVPVPHESTADAIAAELGSMKEDGCLIDALQRVTI